MTTFNGYISIKLGVDNAGVTISTIWGRKILEDCFHFFGVTLIRTL
jgi:hypothetical protein